MRYDENEDDSETFDLPEIDVFAQVAQTLVAQVRAMLEHRSVYQPTDASSFPQRNAAFYARTERELAQLGFETLGDFEDAGIAVTDPAMKSFVRFALGAHGAISAMWFEVPNAQGDPLHCLVLHTWLAGGSVLVTARGAIDNGLPQSPHISVDRVDADVDTTSTVRRHGERVAATGKAPRRHSSADDIFAAMASDEAATGEFRTSQGVALFEPMLRTMLGPMYDEQGAPILETIRRHPEWMEGEITAAPLMASVQASRDENVDLSKFPHLVIARMPEHIEPMDRGSRYEDPLQDALGIREMGAVTGGGSQLTAEAEIAFVDIELALADLNGALDVTKRILEEAGAPVGSQLLFEEAGHQVERAFGVQEGLSVYLDGTSLPDEVYQTTDINAVIERVAEAVGAVGGELRGIWNGSAETALHHYGPSAEAMLDALEPLFEEYPIFENARIVMRRGQKSDTTLARVRRRQA
jgi:hypothetical protein